MRYTEQKQARAKVLAVNTRTSVSVKGGMIAVYPLARGGGVDACYGVEIDEGKATGPSRHVVELYRAERIFVCDCIACENGLACRHVGMALEAHDAELEYAEAEAEESAVIEQLRETPAPQREPAGHDAPLASRPVKPFSQWMFK